MMDVIIDHVIFGGFKSGVQRPLKKRAYLKKHLFQGRFLKSLTSKKPKHLHYVNL